ncbi:MAG: hypothetical protein ACRDE2_07900 [Chitinophagaceae bacterium]
MSGRPRMWVYSPYKEANAKLSTYQKEEIEAKCKPVIGKFRKQYIKEKPDKRFNYTVDIFLKWRGSYLYFIQRMRSDQEGYPSQEFNVGFARLGFIKNDWVNLSYFRHTNQWFLIETGLSLEDGLEMIESIPAFHPVG